MNITWLRVQDNFSGVKSSCARRRNTASKCYVPTSILPNTVSRVDAKDLAGAARFQSIMVFCF